MKQLVRKERSLSLVPSVSEPAESTQGADNFSLKEYFDGWLDSVRPSLPNTQAAAEQRRKNPGSRPITSRDLLRVDRETVRESNTHRPWPREVVEKFLAAHVIKRR